MSRENGVVEFDTDFLPYFREHYPMFKNPPYTDAILEGMFDFATTIVANTPKSRPRICWSRRRIMYCYLVAHMGALIQRGMGAVGSITSVSQGSVSQGMNAITTNINNQWFGQTQWGLMYLQMTSLYRLFRYVPSPRCYWK